MAEKLYAQGLTKAEIARKLGRSDTSVGRAVNPEMARAQRAKYAAKHRPPPKQLECDPEIPGLLPIRNRDGAIVDFAQVDIGDWERLRGVRLHIKAKGYVGIGPGGYLHHLVLGEHLTRASGVECDHIDRDKLNNRRSNLRVVTSEENCANRGGKFAKAA